MKVSHRFIRSAVALAVVASGLVTAVSVGSSAASATTPTGPVCTFNGGRGAIIFSAKPGQTIAISCTGLPPLHPYLMMETSLLLAIDPAAKPLLTGQVVSVPGLLALLSALPEINPAALTFPISDLSGNLNINYTLPTSNAPDPNATCPPSQHEDNAGLVGCAIATIDLTSFKPLAAGSALVNFFGTSLFPASPKIAIAPTTASPGQQVTVSDPPGATTYWWLATLAALTALLSGASAPPSTISVKLSHVHGKLANTVAISPAVYNAPVLTPPKISGGFTVPSGISGLSKLTISDSATLQGIPLSIVASAKLFVP